MAEINSTVTQEITSTSEMEGKYLTFWMGDQLFALPIADVVQIVGVQPITEVPEFPYYAKGVIDLRGSILPIIDFRLRLGKEEIPYGERTCFIVTKISDQLVGIAVDSVSEVFYFPPEEVAPPPEVSGDNTNRFFIGIGKNDDKMVLLLDTKKVTGGSLSV